MKLSRSWLMALCLVGMSSVFILPALGISLGILGSFLLVLLCPLSHILMMRGVRGEHEGHGQGKEVSGAAERRRDLPG